MSPLKILKSALRNWIYFILVGFIFLAQFGSELIVKKPYDVLVPSVSISKEETQKLQQYYQQLDQSLKESLKKPENLAWVTGMGLLMIGLLALGCILLSVWGVGFLLRPVSGTERVPWGVGDVCRVAILAIFFGQVFAIFGLSLAHFFFKVKIENESFLMLFATLFVDVFSFLFILYFMYRRKQVSVSTIGLTQDRFFSNIGIGLMGYLSSLPVFVALLLAVLGIAHLLHYDPPPQPIQEIFFGEKANETLLIATFFVALAAPFFEEVFFRGFLYNALKHWMSPVQALLINSLLFAWLHANLIGFVPILFLGILLTLLYEKTGSLVSSITVHMLHNSVMVGVVFVIKALVGT